MKKNGYTLVELMIYVMVSALIIAAVYAAVVMAQRSSSSVDKKTITQQDARLVLDMMAMEIRNASYNSLHKTSLGFWLDLTGIPLTADNGLYGIQAADQYNILVEMDLNGAGIIGPTGSNEAIYYKYNAANNQITRNNQIPFVTGNDQAFFGGAGSGTLVHNAQVAVPLFRYFDGSGNELLPVQTGAQSQLVLNPALNRAIRRITITIVADTETNDPLTNAPKRMVYTTDVLVKNHAVAAYTY
jgi:type II secretory pathway component PulJ